MKLLLRRDQKKSIIGNKMIFTLDARAELLPEEKDAVQKYKMAGTMLYEKFKVIDKGSGIRGLISRFLFRFVNVTISVENLVKGKHIECKDIVEMRSVEEQIKEASQVFKNILDTAAHFGGEEVIEI